jgi:uncharacterized damage-inducible protein DinB
MSLVEEAVSVWERTRAGFIAELDNIPEEQFEYRPGAGARSVREVALHVVDAGTGFVAQLMSPEGSFRKLLDPAYQAELRASMPPARTKAEVLELLAVSGERIFARVRAVGESLVSQQLNGFAGPQSRLSQLWFAIQHEGYHRGQLTAYARGMGAVPAMTQRLAAPPK